MSMRLDNVHLHGLGLTDDFLLNLSDRAQTKKIEHTAPETYKLPSRMPLEEAIGDAWENARKKWARHQKYPPKFAKEYWTDWVRPLLRELDYSCNDTDNHATGGPFTINRLTETGDVPIHYVDPIQDGSDWLNPDLDKVHQLDDVRTSPHGRMQGYLNNTPEHLWGLVTNGEVLRLLRDNGQVTRPAYAEFHLGEIMRQEDSRAFRVLWLLLHRSRLTKGKNSLLEQWNTRAKNEGVKARDTLRQGVQQAIEAVGSGFLASNPKLRTKLKEGTTTPQELYRACLKMVYQTVFLFVTEDRDLLFARDENGEYVPDAQTRERASFYLTKSLRQKATTVQGQTHHFDAYRGWKTLLHHLSEGFEPLGLPALNSDLFTKHLLSGLELDNRSFYQAIRALCEIHVDKQRRPVNYASLDSEELGSIYESLLELVPQIAANNNFHLKTLQGNERKTTGSYYTPAPLIELLLENALDPVLDDATQNKPPEEAKKALLNLKIIDPACGSGHFLIAAARRTGMRLAELEEQTSQPSPAAHRQATRTVIAHCIYGVDINPMAVELAKVALWLESQDAGKPLAFLDHRLRVGNSLLGTTPELMYAEDEIPEKAPKNKPVIPAVRAQTLHIPDTAFKALQGDDKKTVAALKKENKSVREHLIKRAHGGQHIEDFISKEQQVLTQEFKALNAIEPNSLEEVRQQEAKFKEIRENAQLKANRLLADAWCTAFVAPKTEEDPKITTKTLQDIKKDPNAEALAPIHKLINDTVKQYKFFHPHIEFPHVFTGNKEEDGFDCVLGNPPWEQIQLDPAEFFAPTRPEISNAPNMAAKEKLIKQLATEHPPLFKSYIDAKRELEGIQHFIHTSGRFPTTSFGRLNTAPLFTELATKIVHPLGTSGTIVPTGIATDSFNQHFFKSLIDSKRLISLLDFENRAKLFPAVDSRMKFCTITLGGKHRITEFADFAFFALSPEETKLDDKRFQLSKSDIELLNPNTKTTPIFRSLRDAKLTKEIYQRIPILIREKHTSYENDVETEFPEENPWDIKLMLMFMMNTDSHIFKTADQLEDEDYALEGNCYSKGEKMMLPLYEAKMMHQFDHRFATYAKKDKTRDLNREEKIYPDTLPLPRYWVKEEKVEEKLIKKDKNGNVNWEWDKDWLMGWRDISNSTNERTFIGTVYPRYAAGDTFLQMLSNKSTIEITGLLANLNSFINDYAVRQKVGGTHLKYNVTRQFPVLPPSVFTPERLAFITPRVLELTYTAHDLAGFAQDLGYTGEPFIWNEDRRFWLRAELDALYFILYGIEREDVAYIMDTFPIVRRKDEAAHDGRYVTKEAILQVYDQLQMLGLERLDEYESVVPGGKVAGGWQVAKEPEISTLITEEGARAAIAELYSQYPKLGDLDFQEQLFRDRAARSGDTSQEGWKNYILEYMCD